MPPVTPRLMLAALLGTALAAPARADLVVVPDSDPTALLTALLGDTAGLSNFSATATGDGRAFGRFAGGQPAVGLASGVVLSTGRAADVAGPNSSASITTDLAGTDDIRLRLAFTADPTATTLFFRFVFGSDEFTEFAGTAFNDRFELTLNGANLARLTDGREVTVNNLAASPNGPFSPDLVLNPAGSPGLQLDGYTVPLTFAGPLAVGANVLEVRVADVGDGIVDSAVFLEGGTLGSGPVGPGPVIPAPPAAVLAAVAGLVLVRRRS